MAEATVIEARGLVKRYGDVEAVRGLDLAVHAGETFGFLGPNGAGKSTTIKILCTLANPTAGEASVAGFDVVRERAAVRRNIGLVFQDRHSTRTSRRSATCASTASSTACPAPSSASARGRCSRWSACGTGALRACPRSRAA